MEGGWWVAAGSIITAAIAAIGTVLINWVRERHRSKQEDLKATSDRHELIIDRQEKQITRMQAVVDELHESNQRIREEYACCRAELKGQRVWVQTFHRIAVGLARWLRSAGHEVEDIPPLPDGLKECESSETPEEISKRVEFEARSNEQNVRLTTELRQPKILPVSTPVVLPSPPVQPSPPSSPPSGEGPK